MNDDMEKGYSRGKVVALRAPAAARLYLSRSGHGVKGPKEHLLSRQLTVSIDIHKLILATNGFRRVVIIIIKLHVGRRG